MAKALLAHGADAAQVRRQTSAVCVAGVHQAIPSRNGVEMLVLSRVFIVRRLSRVMLSMSKLSVNTEAQMSDTSTYQKPRE